MAKEKFHKEVITWDAIHGLVDQSQKENSI